MTWHPLSIRIYIIEIYIVYYRAVGFHVPGYIGGEADVPLSSAFLSDWELSWHSYGSSGDCFTGAFFSYGNTEFGAKGWAARRGWPDSGWSDCHRRPENDQRADRRKEKGCWSDSADRPGADSVIGDTYGGYFWHLASAYDCGGSVFPLSKMAADLQNENRAPGGPPLSGRHDQQRAKPDLVQR